MYSAKQHSHIYVYNFDLNMTFGLILFVLYLKEVELYLIFLLNQLEGIEPHWKTNGYFKAIVQFVRVSP